jgi:hypothetical protein
MSSYMNYHRKMEKAYAPSQDAFNSVIMATDNLCYIEEQSVSQMYDTTACELHYRDEGVH